MMMIKGPVKQSGTTGKSEWESDIEKDTRRANLRPPILITRIWSSCARINRRLTNASEKRHVRTWRYMR